MEGRGCINHGSGLRFRFCFMGIYGSIRILLQEIWGLCRVCVAAIWGLYEDYRDINIILEMEKQMEHEMAIGMVETLHQVGRGGL